MVEQPYTDEELQAGAEAVTKVRHVIASDGYPSIRIGTSEDEARTVLSAVAPLIVARVRAEPRGYVQDGETPCGEPHPEGGEPCQLRPGHDGHARPASGGFDGWKREEPDGQHGPGFCVQPDLTLPEPTGDEPDEFPDLVARLESEWRARGWAPRAEVAEEIADCLHRLAVQADAAETRISATAFRDSAHVAREIGAHRTTPEEDSDAE